MSHQPRDRRASAVVWDWRGEPDGGPAADATTRVRRRGLVRGGIGLAVAAALALWKPVLGAVAAGIALLFLAAALLAPRTLYRRLEGWIATFGRGVGLAVSWATLTAVHLLVFLPLGLFLRATGRLRIDPDLDPEAPTYWRPADSTARHDRQF